MGHRLALLIAVASVALAPTVFAADSNGASPSAAPTSAVATASTSTVATAPNDGTASQIDAWLSGDGEAPSSPAPAATSQSAAQGVRTIHGEASVGFGSNGYREAEIAAAIPIGQSSTLGVAVGDGSYRGRDRRSLAVSLAVGEGATLEPCGVRHTGVLLANDAARLARCGEASNPIDP